MNLVFQSLFIFLWVCLSQTACASTTIEDTVRQQFSPLIDKDQAKEKQFQSVLVAVVTPFETKIIPVGKLDDQGTVANELTIFEIGSITKGFLGLLLANEDLKGAIDIDRPFSSMVPLKLPSFQGQEITWKNLAQHTAGFPRVPTNLKSTDPLQPYQDYDSQQLVEFFEGFELQSKPGIESNYSNLGAGLVGYGLEKIHGKSLESVLKESLLNPLQMENTIIFPDADQEKRIAPVFLNGEQGQVWQWKDSSVLQGAGAIKSTIHDMTILMKTMMGLMSQDFLPITELATKPTFEKNSNSQLGLFWNHLKAENIIWHNGGTYGSSSFFGYDPDKLVGVIALSNSMVIDENGVDPRLDIASIKTILQAASGLGIDKPVKVLKDYDSEVLKRINEFEKTPGDINDKDWVKSKLAHMFDIDQYMRKLFMAANEQGFTGRELEFFQKGYSRRFTMIDWQNTQDLKLLLKKYGWFKISEWGQQADRQAWLLVQHADNEPDFQNEVLSKLSKLYKSNETSPSNYAYLYDRVASSFKDPSKKKPQRYGTQGSCVGPGQWEPLEMEDPENVNKRRAEVGLPPLEEYIAGFKDICR
jgi:CubicO group peptidase (beta-lactamase class C family)